MVVHPAFGSEAADAGTRIHALVALAGLGPIAVGMNQTFWATAFVWVAEELRETAAHSDVVVYATLGVRATFARVARVLWCLGSWSG